MGLYGKEWKLKVNHISRLLKIGSHSYRQSKSYRLMIIFSLAFQHVEEVDIFNFSYDALL